MYERATNERAPRGCSDLIGQRGVTWTEGVGGPRENREDRPNRTHLGRGADSCPSRRVVLVSTGPCYHWTKFDWNLQRIGDVSMHTCPLEVEESRGCTGKHVQC